MAYDTPIRISIFGMLSTRIIAFLQEGGEVVLVKDYKNAWI